MHYYNSITYNTHHHCIGDSPTSSDDSVMDTEQPVYTSMILLLLIKHIHTSSCCKMCDHYNYNTVHNE